MAPDRAVLFGSSLYYDLQSIGSYAELSRTRSRDT